MPTKLPVTEPRDQSRQACAMAAVLLAIHLFAEIERNGYSAGKHGPFDGSYYTTCLRFIYGLVVIRGFPG